MRCLRHLPRGSERAPVNYQPTAGTHDDAGGGAEEQGIIGDEAAAGVYLNFRILKQTEVRTFVNDKRAAGTYRYSCTLFQNVSAARFNCQRAAFCQPNFGIGVLVEERASFTGKERGFGEESRLSIAVELCHRPVLCQSDGSALCKMCRFLQRDCSCPTNIINNIIIIPSYMHEEILIGKRCHLNTQPCKIGGLCFSFFVTGQRKESI